MAKPHQPARGDTTALLLAVCFGAGRLPWAPGTWGSLFACGAAAALVWGAGAIGLPGSWFLSLATIVVFLAGVWASGRYAQTVGKDDPGEVVIDEVAGQWLTLLPVATNFALYPLAFVLFRLFDITKPWPARRVERMHGGVGVMTDDIVAGFYAGIIVWLVSLWLA